MLNVALMAQTSITGQVNISGSTSTQPIQPVAQAGDFVAALPINWVNSHQCDAPGGVYDVDVTLGTQTIAALLTAVNVWAGGADQWYRIKIPAGWVLHGSTFDANNALISMPAKAGATKCLVIESTTPNTAATLVCSHGLPGYGGTRNPGCTNDIAKMWTLRGDSATIAGNSLLYMGTGVNHIVVRDAELTIAAGAFQSASGVKVMQAAQMELGAANVALERNYIHGFDPGDSGQPGGACSAWTMTGTVNTSGTSVTWVSGKRFGMSFADATHSTGYPQATITINGTNYTISSHDPVVSDTTLTLTSTAGTQTAVAYTLSNPPTTYANGCGDDLRGVQVNCDNCWFAYNYIEKIHWFGGESHAISSGFSNGPTKFVHNWVEGGSCTFFSGGNSPDLRGGPVRDVEIRGNYFGKDLNWRFLSAGAGRAPEPPFGCGPLDNSASHANCPMSWAIKNTIEFKMGNRALISGNIVENSWADGQSGYLVLLTVSACAGGSICGSYGADGLPEAIVQNVRFENNWFRNTPQVIQIRSRSLSPGNGAGVSNPMTNLDFINNVISNVGDIAQSGDPGPDLVQWAASSNSYRCTMSRTSGTAKAHCSVIPIGNLTNTQACSPCNYDFPIFDSAFDVKSVIRSGGIVTVTFVNTRLDPMVGGNAVISGTTGWSGTFPITGVLNSAVTTACTTDLLGNLVASNIAVGPQPCVRADGTFGDSITYADAQGANGTLCANKTACDALNSGAGIRLSFDSLAYKMTDIAVGDNVFVHDWTSMGGFAASNCPASYKAGASSTVLAVAPTVATGLDVYYLNPGADDNTGVQCAVDNGGGLPRHTTFQYNTTLAVNIMSIGSNGADNGSQHFNNRFYHNVFAMPTGSNAVLACSGVATQGNTVYPCWDLNTFNFYDNVMQGRTLSSWTPYPLAAAANITPANVTCSGATADATCLGFTGFMSGTVFPTTNCPTANAPFNCTLMAAPWSTNFDLTKIVPVGTSLFSAEGANLVTLQDAFTRTIYVCPTGANCGTMGPQLD